MTRFNQGNMGASVRQKLFNMAKQRKEDFQLVLIRYGLERFLYRLSKSEFAKKFILKGATLFSVWEGDTYRPTRDVDFLGFGENSIENLERVLQIICDVEVEDDGLRFLKNTVRGTVITEDEEYQGIRLNFFATLSAAKIPLQIDVGFGDAITPAPKYILIPTLLDMPAPRLRGYPPETVLSEKFEILVDLGMANSRMKDFYDIYTLSQRFGFKGTILQQAIKRTFERRKTIIPSETPLAMTAEFFEDAGKQRQWIAFLKKNQLEVSVKLDKIIRVIKEFLLPPARAILKGESFNLKWEPGGPWK